MSQANNVEDVKQKEVVDDSEKNQVDDDKADDQKDQILGDEGGAVIQEEVKDSHENNKSPMPSALQEVNHKCYISCADLILHGYEHSIVKSLFVLTLTGRSNQEKVWRTST